MSILEAATLGGASETRIHPMKVLVLGMGRTGTTSLAAALVQLGLKPYDWVDRFALGHLSLWEAAVRAKIFGEGDLYGKIEFDKLTKDFDCILDTPCCFLAENLVAAYPDAKIVLNWRDPDQWLASMNSTLFEVHKWRFWEIVRYTDPSFIGTIRSHALACWGVFCDNDIDNREKCLQRYDEHYAHVRKVVPKERLLEWQVTDGWAPLCTFLGIETPEGGFPHVNDKEEIISQHIWIRNVGILRTLVNGLTYGSMVWAPLLMWWIWLSWV